MVRGRRNAEGTGRWPYIYYHPWHVRHVAHKALQQARRHHHLRHHSIKPANPRDGAGTIWKVRVICSTRSREFMMRLFDGVHEDKTKSAPLGYRYENLAPGEPHNCTIDHSYDVRFRRMARLSSPSQTLVSEKERAACCLLLAIQTSYGVQSHCRGLTWVSHLFASWHFAVTFHGKGAVSWAKSEKGSIIESGSGGDVYCSDSVESRLLPVYRSERVSCTLPCMTAAD